MVEAVSFGSDARESRKDEVAKGLAYHQACKEDMEKRAEAQCW
jgi:hypothetical protein